MYKRYRLFPNSRQNTIRALFSLLILSFLPIPPSHSVCAEKDCTLVAIDVSECKAVSISNVKLIQAYRDSFKELPRRFETPAEKVRFAHGIAITTPYTVRKNVACHSHFSEPRDVSTRFENGKQTFFISGDEAACPDVLGKQFVMIENFGCNDTDFTHPNGTVPWIILTEVPGSLYPSSSQFLKEILDLPQLQPKEPAKTFSVLRFPLPIFDPKTTIRIDPEGLGPISLPNRSTDERKVRRTLKYKQAEQMRGALLDITNDNVNDFFIYPSTSNFGEKPLILAVDGVRHIVIGRFSGQSILLERLTNEEYPRIHSISFDMKFHAGRPIESKFLLRTYLLNTNRFSEISCKVIPSGSPLERLAQATNSLQRYSHQSSAQSG